MIKQNLIATDEQVRRAARAAIFGEDQEFIDDYLEAYMASGQVIRFHGEIFEWILDTYEKEAGEGRDALEAWLNVALMMVQATVYLANNNALPSLSEIDSEFYIGFENWDADKSEKRAQLGRDFVEELNGLLAKTLTALFDGSDEVLGYAVCVCIDILSYAFACEAQSE